MGSADCDRVQDGLRPSERADLCLGPISSTQCGEYIRCHDNPDHRFRPVQLKGAPRQEEAACQAGAVDRTAGF